MTLLMLPNVLVANPHWYDYLHHFKLDEDGSVEMVDGGGQVINAVVRGKVAISPLNDTEADISFSKLVEYNPYQKKEKIRDLPDFATTFTKEEGIYAFYEETFGRIDDPDKVPCLLYRVRYVFEADPLQCVAENQQGNLYNMTENRDFVNSVRVYYARDGAERLSLRELRKKLRALGLDTGLDPI